ncbi:MAG: hypothetical protein E7172_04520 [Firmicutes bacterium]|nr:hypothetical protein [Bacillota bacterium]
MKKNLSKVDYTLIIITVLLILIAIILGIFVEIKGQSLNPKEELVQNIYKYLGSNDLNNCQGLYAYNNKKLMAKDILLEEKICTAYYNLNEDKIIQMKIDTTKNSCKISEKINFSNDINDNKICSVTKVLDQDLIKQYKQMFHENMNNIDSFSLNNNTICYYENNYFYCGNKDEYTIDLNDNKEIYRSIKKVYKKNNIITIYDYFIKKVGEYCYKDQNEVKKMEKCKEQIDSNFLINYGTLYKHTFKEIDGKYYWYSSEVEK